jgi:hypothetical protein
LDRRLHGEPLDKTKHVGRQEDKSPHQKEISSRPADLNRVLEPDAGSASSDSWSGCVPRGIREAGKCGAFSSARGCLCVPGGRSVDADPGSGSDVRARVLRRFVGSGGSHALDGGRRPRRNRHSSDSMVRSPDGDAHVTSLAAGSKNVNSSAPR